jgi:hypothetical protein
MEYMFFGFEAEISPPRTATIVQNKRTKNEKQFASRKTPRLHINAKNKAK